MIRWSILAFLAMAVAAYAIAVVIAAPIRPPIVRDLLANWPLAAPAHFLGGAVALVLGALQMNSRLRTRYRVAHRWTGRVYLAAIAVGATSGFALALDSFAGPVARAGFALLALAWLATSSAAYLHIRRRNIAAHRDWMVRSYALTLAAVTLRIYLPASQIAGIPFMLAYPAIAWLCWVPNLAVAEWLVRSGRVPAAGFRF